MSELEKVKPTKTTLKIHGKEREIRYGFSAWAELEEKYGGIENFSKIEDDIKQRPFKTIPELIYIGLVDKTDVTKENCLDDYSMGDLENIVNILEKSLYGSLPKEGSEKKRK